MHVFLPEYLAHVARLDALNGVHTVLQYRLAPHLQLDVTLLPVIVAAIVVVMVVVEVEVVVVTVMVS